MPLSDADSTHLLRRTGFGITEAGVARLAKARTRRQAVNQVLNLKRAPADDFGLVRDADGVFGEWWRFTSWWIDRMRTSPTPIVERMTMFWHDHFVSATDKCPSMELLLGQHRTLRANALGDFHDLSQAIAVDPAMLIYLDNWLNVSSGPQENFARELMELFTLGVGNYDESDVAEMARAWTGYGLSADFRSLQFRDEHHDHGPKRLFGLPERQWTGPEAITEILHGSLSVPSSQFIAAKVFSHFAYPIDPSDPAIVPIAEQFRSSGLDILRLVRAVLMSDEFWSERARHGLVRSPIEWFVASMQALDLTTDQALVVGDILASGQIPFAHPDVDGWGQNDYWISTASQWSRSQWASRIRWVAYFHAAAFDGFDTLPVQEAVDRGLDRFGIVSPSQQTRDALVAWAERSHAVGDAHVIPLNLTMLLMLSPEFQMA